ncbi:MAG TPA: tetratricopeptide repeat protein [Kiloniellaceae bacterium]|nr:tetratricopeptide repeat protein [Kiloniellaceae bacterium]
MHRLALVLVLAAGLGACAASPPKDLTEAHRLCKQIEQGVTTQATVDGCTEVIEHSRSRDERVTAYNLRGVANEQLGRIDEAFADFDEAVRLAPYFSAAYNNRANLFSRQGNNARAVQSFQAAIRANPDNAAAYNNYAWYLASRGDYDGALARVEKALALDSDYDAALDTYGHVLMGLGQAEAAMSAFERVIILEGPKVVRLYQEALEGWGYEPGRTDGVMDAQTDAALSACVRDNCRLLLD